MTSTVLFFPWPVGAGHTGRCLVLATLLRQRCGTRCVFALDGSLGEVEGAGFRVVGPPWTTRLHPGSGYAAIPGLDAYYGYAGLYNLARLSQRLHESLDLIRAVRPDVVVTHMDPVGAMAARLSGIPLVSLAERDFLDPAPNGWMPWLPTESVARYSPFPSFKSSAARVFEEFGGASCDSDPAALLRGDTTIMATAEFLEPVWDLDGGDSGVVYVGPMIWSPRDEVLSEPTPTHGRLRVYVSVGGGVVGPGGLLTACAETAAVLDHIFVVSAGAGPQAEHPPPGVTIAPFGSLRAGMRWADVSVCHGGHSTVIASLMHGRPTLVAPAVSENEANGRLLVEANGAGFCIWTSHVDGGQAQLRLQTRNGSNLERPELTGELLTTALAELRERSEVATAAAHVAAEFQRGASKGRTRLLDALDPYGL